MAQGTRPFCSDTSRQAGESPAATASRVDHWLLVEYGGRWERDPVEGSLLPAAAKEHLREQAARLSHARLLFIRRPERRDARDVHVYAVRSGATSAHAFGRTLADARELASLDAAAMLEGDAEPADGPLVLVCTHGRRDRCCSRHGAAVYARAREELGDAVWQCTHVGGDRFAGNLVCLPEGLYFGHLDAGATTQVLREYTAGRIEPAHYRGRSCHSLPQQAAERAVREAAGAWELHAVRFVTWRRVDAHEWLVRFAAAGQELEARVTRTDGDPTYLTCDALTVRRPRRFVAELV
jgi:hypothetical protein